MKWKKQGFLIRPNNDIWWMKTHAMIPTIDRLDKNVCRVYFSGRNSDNQSHIGWVDVDLRNPTTPLEIAKDPILKPGKLGTFDDNGVTPSCIINHNGKKYLYYIGWNPGSTVRMHLFGGLAISEDQGKTFDRYSEAPIIERNKVNPYLNTAPFVLKETGSDWKMYYVAGVEWVHKDLPRYNIQIATSQDGCNWIREGIVAIDFENGENALARPFVLKNDDLYEMWFASKGESYSLKYAQSKNGLHWKRVDIDDGIAPGDSFDSEMVEYAAIAVHNEKRVMFYNGNNYGAQGILVATQET